MKRVITLSIAVLVAFTAFGQATPPIKTRSNATFQQEDKMLIASERLGIPTGTTPTLTATTSAENTSKLFYDTDDKALMVYDPVSTTWSAVSVDLTSYYTKNQVDSAITAEIASIPTPSLQSVTENGKTTNQGIDITSGGLDVQPYLSVIDNEATGNQMSFSKDLDGILKVYASGTTGTYSFLSDNNLGLYRNSALIAHLTTNSDPKPVLFLRSGLTSSSNTISLRAETTPASTSNTLTMPAVTDTLATKTMLGAYIPISGNMSTPMTGTLNLGNNEITNASSIRAGVSNTHRTVIVPANIQMENSNSGLHIITAQSAGPLLFQTPTAVGSTTSSGKFQLLTGDNQPNPSLKVADFFGSVHGKMSGTGDPNFHVGQFTTKPYVDSQLGNYIPITGGTTSGPLGSQVGLGVMESSNNGPFVLNAGFGGTGVGYWDEAGHLEIQDVLSFSDPQYRLKIRHSSNIAKGPLFEIFSKATYNSEYALTDRKDLVHKGHMDDAIAAAIPDFATGNYTPTFYANATVISGVTVAMAKYQKLGKSVTVWLDINVSGAADNGNVFRFSLPTNVDPTVGSSAFVTPILNKLSGQSLGALANYGGGVNKGEIRTETLSALTVTQAKSVGNFLITLNYLAP